MFHGSLVLQQQSTAQVSTVTHAAISVYYVYTIKKYIIIPALTYTTYCYVFHVRSANQPRITTVAICHKKVRIPTARTRAGQHAALVHRNSFNNTI
jgi:hypothetical protein